MGSEMCIRDRVDIGGAIGVPDLRLGVLVQGQDQFQPTTRVARLCLLYTSDAADERSSVDLGGRRIIKKKKHRTHVRRERQCISTTSSYAR